MAEQQKGFSYHDVVLHKSQVLGSGSYGEVCKAECDGLLCAAKIMHPALFDLRDPGTASRVHRFEEECRLLCLARHPNLVQYLATYRDPETHLPVLVMELCDESLSRFLERSVEPLPYHTELNISHDVALALVYLHSNGLIHGDLTGNNVLMIAGVRAKVTDFGIPKLASVNPRMTPLTLSPASVHYMPPQAFQEPPSYSNKLDTFSFGVLLVQIMTRQFPNPGPNVSDNPAKPISETQRRSAHLQLINGAHPLKSIALSCLRRQEKKRPSAQQLSSSLSELKGTPGYAESMQQAQGGGEKETSLQKQVDKLKKQNRKQQQENDQKQHTIEQLQAEQKELTVQFYQQGQQQQKQKVLHKREKELLREIEEKEQEIITQKQEIEQIQMRQKELTTQVRELGKLLEHQQVLAEKKAAELQQLQHTEKEKRKKTQKRVVELQQEIEQKQLENEQLQKEIKRKEQEVRQQKQQSQHVQTELKQVMEKVHVLGQQLREQHITTQTTTVQCQQLRIKVQEKERIIQRKNHDIQRKEKQLGDSKQLVAQLQHSIEQKGMNVGMATSSEAPTSIAKLRLEEGMPAPQRMDRGSTVVDGNTIFVNPDGSNKLYSCQMTHGEQQWYSLPDNEYQLFSLAVIGGLLTSIGGQGGGYGSTHSNNLLSLTGSHGDSVWEKVFPPMPTARSDTASVTTEEALVVAGGWDGKQNLVTVEVMNIPTKQWSAAECLPHPFGVITGTISRDQLYLGGGFIEMGQASKSILTCSLNDLLQPQSLGAKLHNLSLSDARPVWRELKQLPVTQSTLTTLGGFLLAVGGRDDSDSPTADIHCYDPQVNSWYNVMKMKTERFFCLTATLPEDKIVIIGGRKGTSELTDSVEIGNLID